MFRISKTKNKDSIFPLMFLYQNTIFKPIIVILADREEVGWGGGGYASSSALHRVSVEVRRVHVFFRTKQIGNLNLGHIFQMLEELNCFEHVPFDERI